MVCFLTSSPFLMYFLIKKDHGKRLFYRKETVLEMIFVVSGGGLVVLITCSLVVFMAEAEAEREEDGEENDRG